MRFPKTSGLSVCRLLTICFAVFLSQSAIGELVITEGFESDGMEIRLQSVLSAESGTLNIRFKIPQDWPSESRETLFHVGEKSHVHVTLFTNAGRLTAVYKAGEKHYYSINVSETTNWVGGTWHEAVFSWKAVGENVDFYLELDKELAGRQTGKLIEEWPSVGYIGARGSRDAWAGTIDRVHLSKNFTVPYELRPGSRTINVDGDKKLGVCTNFWSINNYTSQHMFLDPDYPAKARQDKPFMKYVNCVRMLGGREDGLNAWFKGIGKNGEVLCDFSGMIKHLQGIQDAGYTPRIVLDNIPTAMSEPGEMATYGNTRPAMDLKVWHSYIQQAIQSMVDAFGMETVSQWRIRVGTEPDLYPGHWRGTKEEYLQHYDCTVDAVLSVIPNAEIGPGNVLNPSIKDRVNGIGQKPWGLDIIDHCATGTNTWSGKTGTAMTFFECSWYGQVGRAIGSINVAIQRMRERLDRYPQFADLPISISEFSILRDEHNYRGQGDITEWGASWYAAIADRVYDLNIEQVHEWGQTTRGILHPKTQVIGLLERMQNGQLLQVDVAAESAANAGAIACLKDGRYYVLLYNHRPWRSPSLSEQIELSLNSLGLGNVEWTLSEWGIDREHGVFAHQFYKDCEEAGLESLPNAAQFGGNIVMRYGPGANRVLEQNRSKYEELSQPVLLRNKEPLTVTNDTVQLLLNMPGHSVRLLEISPK